MACHGMCDDDDADDADDGDGDDDDVMMMMACLMMTCDGMSWPSSFVSNLSRGVCHSAAVISRRR